MYWFIFPLSFVVIALICRLNACLSSGLKLAILIVCKKALIKERMGRKVDRREGDIRRNDDKTIMVTQYVRRKLILSSILSSNIL